MPELPGHQTIKTSTAVYVVDHYEHELTVHCNEDKIFNLNEYNRIVEQNRIKEARIVSPNSLRVLNSVFNSANSMVNIPTIIDVNPTEVHNDSNIAIENLPSNIKIEFYNCQQLQYEFITWCHKLSNEDKAILMPKLTRRSREQFIEEEAIIKKVYLDVKKSHPRIENYPLKDRYEILFRYALDNFPYCIEALTPDGSRTRPGYEWTHNAIDVFKRKCGVCDGRSNLFKLITNNNYFRIPCYVISGYHGKDGHSWNEVIIDGELFDCDLSYALRRFDVDKNKAYEYDERDSNILRYLKNKSGVVSSLEVRRLAPPALPKRRPTPPPLPQRTKQKRITPPPLPARRT